ncbi:MAG: type II secretion system protein GspG [Opitutales bacterium]
MNIPPLQNQSTSRRARRAFTLIELLMVIAVIAILASITVGISRGVGSAKARATAQAELAVIAQALEQFKLRYGTYPPVNDDAEELFAALEGEKRLERDDDQNWALVDASTPGEVFIDASKLSIKDPWDSDYIYIFDINSPGWDNFAYLLFSAGPDGAFESIAPSGILTEVSGSDVDNIYSGK